MRFSFLCLYAAFGLAESGGILLLGTSANAAERVVLKYNIFQESVSIPELATFVQTGELSQNLRAFLTMAGKNPEQVRQTLTQEVKVNPVLLSQVLNTPIGTAVLDRLSQVIHKPGSQASAESLRSALVSSALGDGKITMIKILQNYPTQEVDVDGDAIASLYKQLRKLSQRLPKI